MDLSSLARYKIRKLLPYFNLKRSLDNVLSIIIKMKLKSFVRKLAGDLSKNGISPWYDEWELKKLSDKINKFKIYY